MTFALSTSHNEFCALVSRRLRRMAEHIPPCPKVANGRACTPCEELATINQEISNAENFLATLNAKRTIIYGCMNHAHDPLTSKLPAEIISKIFTNFLPVDVDAAYGISTPYSFEAEIVTTPLLLGAVCTAWRAISWSTPQLWTSISVDLEGVVEIHCNILREWLGRSGELPLHINVCMSDSDTDLTYPQEIMDLFVLYSHRWFYFEFDIEPGIFRRLKSAFTRAHILNTLKIGRYGTSKLKLGMIPNLRNLYVDGPYIDLLSGINWQKLTNVKATFSSIDMCFELFSNAFYLTHCTFRISSYGNNSTGTTRDTVLQHNHLVFLHIRNLNMETSASLHLMQFPTLEHLVIDSDSTIDIATISDLLQRSQCSLEILDVDITSREPENTLELELFSLLEDNPSLEILELRRQPRYHIASSCDSIYSLLTLLSTTVLTPFEETAGASTSFLPNLWCLRLRNTELSWKCVLDMLLAHLKPMFTMMARSNEEPAERQHARHLRFLYINLLGLPSMTLELDMAQNLQRVIKIGLEVALDVAIAANFQVPGLLPVIGITENSSFI